MSRRYTSLVVKGVGEEAKFTLFKITGCVYIYL